MDRTSVTVTVNEDLCVGNAMCRAIAPNTFVAAAIVRLTISWFGGVKLGG